MTVGKYYFQKWVLKYFPKVLNKVILH